MESNQIEKQVSLIKSKNGESNPVVNGCQHVTDDANDGASVGYLMQKWAGYWSIIALLEVIVKEFIRRCRRSSSVE